VPPFSSIYYCLTTGYSWLTRSIDEFTICRICKTHVGTVASDPSVRNGGVAIDLFERDSNQKPYIRVSINLL